LWAARQAAPRRNDNGRREVSRLRRGAGIPNRLVCLLQWVRWALIYNRRFGMIWILVLVLVLLAIGGGIALSKFLFLLLVVALVIALLGRRSTV
jgi:hypothetical protein